MCCIPMTVKNRVLLDVLNNAGGVVCKKGKEPMDVIVLTVN